MPRHRLPLAARRRPMSLLVDPGTHQQLRFIQATADGRWGMGRIVDRAVELALPQLLAEAEGRQLVLIAYTRETEQAWGLS